MVTARCRAFSGCNQRQSETRELANKLGTKQNDVAVVLAFDEGTCNRTDVNLEQTGSMRRRECDLRAVAMANSAGPGSISVPLQCRGSGSAAMTERQ